MDARLSALEQYTAKMADVRISRHPLRRDCIFIVNCTEFDIYQDGSLSRGGSGLEAVYC